jgi:hypothetical protein
MRGTSLDAYEVLARNLQRSLSQQNAQAVAASVRVGRAVALYENSPQVARSK